MAQKPWELSEIEKLESVPWKNPVMIQEPVMLFHDGQRFAGSLLFKPEKVLAIEAWRDDAGKFA
nr:hypothetical protein [Candidatus Sigynarchaeota archaeon]